MKQPRLLKANEIEVRIGTINEKGASLLLYKNSRTDMDVLDETYGPGNWQRDHKELKGNIYAGVSVWDDKKSQWVTKWDAGTESMAEKVKGEASDSFKRACVNWGIGRELYTAPFTWISSDKYTSHKNPKTGKLATHDKFVVVEIDYKDGDIVKLEIKNTKTGDVVYSFGTGTFKNPQPKPAAKTTPAPTTKSPEEIKLQTLKSQINVLLEDSLDIKHPASKSAKIVSIISKKTVDTVADAELVLEALAEETLSE